MFVGSAIVLLAGWGLMGVSHPCCASSRRKLAPTAENRQSGTGLWRIPFAIPAASPYLVVKGMVETAPRKADGSLHHDRNRLRSTSVDRCDGGSLAELVLYADRPLPGNPRPEDRRIRDPQRLTDLRLLAAERRAGAGTSAGSPGAGSGRRFVILEGLPPERWDKTRLTAAYWLVGQALGVPFEQNVQGTLLYDVRDTGQDLSQGRRFSVTSYESSFHTDNSFGDSVLDIVGLLCLQTARSGGVDHLVSGWSVCRRLPELP